MSGNVCTASDSPYYDRLRNVSELISFVDGIFDTMNQFQVDAALAKARKLVTDVKKNPGLTGKVGEMIDKQLGSYLSAYDRHEKNIKTLKESHDEARKAISDAGETFRNLSPELLSPLESGIKNITEKVEWAGVLMPVEKYLEGVSQQNNLKREELSKKALDTMAKSLNGNRPDIETGPVPPKEIKKIEDGNNSSHGGGGDTSGGGGGSIPGGGGGSIPGGGGAGGGSIPGGGGAGMISGIGAGGAGAAAAAKYASGLHSGADGIMRTTSPVASGGVGSFKDAQWPQDALKYPINSRMTADGPVGGYLPADVGNANDPRWRSDYSHPAIGSVGEPKAGIAGGMLTPGIGAIAGGGAGALAARGMGALGAGGIGGIGGAGSIGGIGGVGRIGGVGGVGGTGVGGTAGGLTGTTAANAARAGAAGGAASGAAARGGAGMGAFGAGGGAGSGKDNKKSRNLVGYQVVRIDDDEDAAAVDPSLFGAGDASSLQPLDTKEQDKW